MSILNKHNYITILEPHNPDSIIYNNNIVYIIDIDISKDTINTNTNTSKRLTTSTLRISSLKISK